MSAHALNWPEGFKAATSPEAEDSLLRMGHDDCFSTSCQGTDEAIMGMPDTRDGGSSMHLGCGCSMGRTQSACVPCSCRVRHCVN